jgi:hypothetical protein
MEDQKSHAGPMIVTASVAFILAHLSFFQFLLGVPVLFFF